MTILEQLYNGEINPCERFVKKGSEYHKLSAQLIKYIDEFLPLLTKEEKELYEKIEEIISERNCISEREHYIEGFRTGVQLVWDIQNFKSKNFK